MIRFLLIETTLSLLLFHAFLLPATASSGSYSTSKDEANNCWKEVNDLNHLYSQNNYEEAIKQLSLLIVKCPKCADAWLQRAKCYQSTHQEDKSLSDVQKALTIDGVGTDVRCNLLFFGAFIFHSLQKYREAADYYTQTIRLRGESNWHYGDATYEARGECYLLDDQVDLAIKDLKKAIKFHRFGGGPASWHFLGRCYEKKSNKSKALHAYHKAGKILSRFDKPEDEYYSLYCENKASLERLQRTPEAGVSQNVPTNLSLSSGIENTTITPALIMTLLGLPENSEVSMRAFFYNCKFEPRSLEKLVKSKRLASLAMIGCHLDKSILNELGEDAKTIASLEIEKDSLRDTDFSILKNFTMLETLKLDETRITGACLAQLPEPSKLKRLSVYHTNFNNRNLRILDRFSNLTNLDIDTKYVTGKAFLENGWFPKLNWFNANFRYGTDSWLRTMSKFSGLIGFGRDGKSLGCADFSGFKFTAASPSSLQCELQFVTNLTVAKAKIGPEAFPVFCRFPKLEILDTSNCGLSGKGFKALRCLAHLSKLKVDNNLLTAEGIQEIGELAHVRYLSIVGTLLRHKGTRLQGLENSTIAVLDCYSNQLTKEDFESISKMQHLAKLGLQGIHVEPWMVDGLARCKHLVVLNLCGAKGLTHSAVRQVATLNQLKTLLIDFSDISDTDKKWLEQNLPNCSFHDDVTITPTMQPRSFPH